jgi:hypothetical protein
MIDKLKLQKMDEDVFDKFLLRMMRKEYVFAQG